MTKPLMIALAVVALAPGCSLGSDDAGGGDDSDIRALAMECLAEEDVEARLVGEEGQQEMLIGPGDDGPRIKFYLTSGEAEAAQFAGGGEGAEQIGATLLYVRDGSDELLERIEGCLADL